MCQTMLSSTNLNVKYLAYHSLFNDTGNMGKNVVRFKSSSTIFDDSPNACVDSDDDKQRADQIIEILMTR